MGNNSSVTPIVAVPTVVIFTWMSILFGFDINQFLGCAEDDKAKQIEQVTPAYQNQNSELRKRSTSANVGTQTDPIEETRSDERSSHTRQDGHLSIVESACKMSTLTNGSTTSHRDDETRLEGKNQKSVVSDTVQGETQVGDDPRTLGWSSPSEEETAWCMDLYDMRSLRMKRYFGKKTSIVIGIDVGTTFSGVSYAILRPNEAAQVQSVTKFSDSIFEGSPSKVPSVIYYDPDYYAAPKAVGAATTEDTVIDEAVEKGWFRCEFFKLHLRPLGLQPETNGLQIGELPLGKTAEEVMADFLHYLVDETGRFISTCHVDGQDLWQQVKDEAIYILSHPSGWSGFTQQRYQKSAILAGFVPNTPEGRNRIKFVTEQEAKALTCLASGLGPTSVKKGFRFITTAVGQATVETTVFEVSQISPLHFKEVVPTDCRFAGSLFVSMRGRELLRRKLANSRYDNGETLDQLMTDEFEAYTMKHFTGETDGLLRVGSRRENNENLGISNGRLRLSREDLAACFEGCIAGIVDSIRGQFAASRSDRRTTPVWLVGDFGSSKYLLSELKKEFEQDETTVQSADTNLSEAVANGAVLHYLNGMVVARVCPTSYGMVCYPRFDPLRSDHSERPELVERRSNGTFIGPIFDVIAQKGSTIDVGKVFTRNCSRMFSSKEAMQHFTIEVLCYDGEPPVPYWYNENKEKFRTVCRLEADLSSLWRETSNSLNLSEVFLAPLLEPCRNVSFDIELKFGEAELEARIKWEESGVVKYAPVRMCWLY